ncbi:hypothetical protein ACGF5M_05100 [Gemmatimonadota bacterium]
MCLRDRLYLIYELMVADFEGDGRRCRLVFEEDRDPVRFRWGELRLAIRPETPGWAFTWIARASGGEWTELERSPTLTFGRLEIPPGTERSALFNIIFHPSILWADFTRTRVVVTQPS